MSCCGFAALFENFEVCILNRNCWYKLNFVSPSWNGYLIFCWIYNLTLMLNILSNTNTTSHDHEMHSFKTRRTFSIHVATDHGPYSACMSFQIFSISYEVRTTLRVSLHDPLTKGHIRA